MSAPAPKLPRQIPFIIGNEACERFSYYGMRNVLTIFLVDYLLAQELSDPAQRGAAAKDVFHTFSAGVYLFPLLGGYLADRWLGKYRTILWLSLVYCAGHLQLALSESSKSGFYLGLFLIALGSGGIKPCVAAMVGDQFDASNRALAGKVFSAFYWSINFGSLFASLFIPVLLKRYGPGLAFGVPGVLMGVATLIFWLGRKHYVLVPPQREAPHGFVAVLATALRGFRPGRPFLAGAQGKHPDAAIAGVRAVLRVLVVFLPIPFFWAVFDQKATTWVLQAKAMEPVTLSLGLFDFTLSPAQMQFINPALVMLLIPLFEGLLYPALTRAGLRVTPLRRMTAGMVLAGLAWAVAGSVQAQLDGGARLSMLSQLGPYVLLTSGEVLLSSTGLAFAYSQAPLEMKSTVMSFWNMTIAVANLAVGKAAVLLPDFKGAPLFWLYASLTLAAAVALGAIAVWYTPSEFFRGEAPGKPASA